MGKKVRKKSRGSAKEKRVATHSPKNVVESGNPSVESVDGVVSVLKEVIPCPHLEKGVNLDILSSKIGSTKPTRCEDCREGAADRRGGKGKGKHGKKKSGASGDSKSESKAIWVCLECGHNSCGGVGLPITPQCHVVRHVKQTCHNLVIHKDKPQLCWCFPCNMLIPVEKNEGTESNRVLSDVVKLLKGRSSEQSSADVEDVWFGSASVASDIKSGTLSASDSYGNGGYIVRGLVNLGNTCFLNSVTQNLLAVDRLRDIFLQIDVSVGPLTSSLKKLFTETNPESGLRNVINPRSFFGAVCSKAPQFRGYQQHDSHELLRCLLDGLSTEELAVRKQNDSPKRGKSSSNMTTIVDSLFGGQISSTVCCVECGHSSMVYEPFLDLSLSVPTKKPPTRKAQQASRTKKTKLPPKKGGKNRVKVNRDSDSLPVQSLSAQSSSHESTCPAQSGVSVAGELVASSGDSTVLGSEKRSNTADKDDSASASSLAAQDSDHANVCHNVTAETSTSLDDFSWLDYVEEGTMDYQPDLISQKNDVSMTQDGESKDECLNEGPVQAISESTSQVSFLNEGKNLRMNSSSGNGLEDEVPLQVQGSEILLLPYKEETSSTADITGRDDEASSSVMGYGQNEEDFDGIGDLFNEPEIVAGPAPRPSSSSDVLEAGFLAGNSSESDPDEVDDTDSPVSVESCLAHFIKPELLSNENGWHCENCSKILQCQKLEENLQAETVSMVVTNRDETGGCDNTWNKDKSCPGLVRRHSNGDIINDKVGENSISNVKNCTELENGQTDEIFHKGEDWETKMQDSNNEELQSSGVHITCGQESCNGVVADSCSIQRMKTVQRRDPQLDLRNNNAEENDDEEMNSNSMKVKRDATMRVLIHKAPPVLTVHLKRFSQDARGRLSKLNGHVSFRETIDLRPYMDPRCINAEEYEYRLVGVVEHTGSMRGGHYVAYVRGGQRNRGKADKETEGSFTSMWYKASDNYVRDVSLEEVLRCEAYILFYEKT